MLLGSSRAPGDPTHVSTLLEGATFPTALWSGSELRFTWMNRVFLDLLEDVRPQWDLLGMPVRGFLSDSHSASYFIDVAYTGQPTTVQRYEFRSIWGEVSHWRLSFLPVPGRIGSPFDVLVVGIDVTLEVLEERRQAEIIADMRRAMSLIDVTVLSSLDAEEILQRVLIEATEALAADWGWIAERDEDAWVFRNVHGWPIEMVGLRFSADDLSMPGLAASSGRSVVVSQSTASSKVHTELMSRHDVGAFALVPLKNRGETSAVMGFCWDADMMFEPAHKELVDKLEMSLSLALENARRFTAERRRARQLIGTFFTAPRAVPGFELGHLYHAPSMSALAGGDFYDVIPLLSGDIGILIGDAGGARGESVGLTTLVKSAMRSEALRLPQPRSVMDHAHELVVHGSGTGECVSAFYGLINGETGSMAYSIAGHPAPVVARPGGEPVFLASNGMPLGGRGADGYEGHTAVLDIGDLLVMYTDGLVEATSPSGEKYGRERLLQAVASVADTPAESVPESLFLSAFSFADGHLAEDIAIVALRRTGPVDGRVQGQLDIAVSAA